MGSTTKLADGENADEASDLSDLVVPDFQTSPIYSIFPAS